MTIHDATNASPMLRQIVLSLRRVSDPEVGLNVVDLGLIYNIHADEGEVEILFTLTNPLCPVREVLAAGIRRAVLGVEGVRGCTLHLAESPSWDPSMISEEGRRILSSSG